MRAAAAWWALLACSSALAEGRYLDFKMRSSESDRFPYYVDGRSLNPAQLPLSDVRAATSAGWQTWEDVTCAYPAFRQVGPSTAEPSIVDPRDPYDTFNVSSNWITSDQDPYYELTLGGGTAAASTLPTRYAGWLYQCDTYLNGANKSWSTQSPTPEQLHDVQTFAVHESGHCLGLAHTFFSLNEVMYPVPPTGAQKRALTNLDAEGLCQYYPQAGAVGSPCGGGDACTNGLTCITPVTADGGTTAKLCSQGCAPQGAAPACPAPFVCKASSQIQGSAGACMPAAGDSATVVGRACTQDDACASAFGVCQRENDPGPLPSGFDAWNDGYCTQSCGAGQEPCPASSTCVDLNGQAKCLKLCRPGTGDCRNGYACADLGAVGAVCISACHDDNDCNPGGGNAFVCRACDGACVARQNAAANIGDPCQVSSECGLGQVCLTLGTQAQGTCSQTCGTTCTACPAGAVCHPLGEVGEFYCLRDCTEGTCPAGQQCGQLATGRGCIPQCQDDLECPVGNQCLSGQCINPFLADGGPCPLCPNPDAGQPPVDAGSGEGEGGEDGCGCQSGGAQGWLWGLAVLLLAAAARGARREG